jgi:CrcB protein
MIYMAIGLLGALGALLRYYLGLLFAAFSFPWGTLLANYLGCFALGWLSRTKVPKWVGTGLIGSFTTFSTFSVETVMFFKQRQFFHAFLYILVSFAGGWLFAQAGRRFLKGVGEDARS